MRRMDVLKEYKGIDAVKDWLSGLSIQIILGGVGDLFAGAFSNPAIKIIYKAAGAISGMALSKEYYDRVSRYLTKKIITKKWKKEGFTEEEINDIIEGLN